MNLNQYNNEYQLNESITDELIKIYGTPVKLVIAEKQNIDQVFGDFSHLKADNSSVFDMYMMAENTEEFETSEMLATQFGVIPESTINFFVSKPELEKLFNKDILFDKIMGSLIVLPSLKVLEITEINLEVPGVNNLFLYNNKKNCYRLKARSYHFKGVNEISSEILDNFNDSIESGNADYQNEFKTLESYFDELSNIKEEQDSEVSNFVKPRTDDVFGRF